MNPRDVRVTLHQEPWADHVDIYVREVDRRAAKAWLLVGDQRIEVEHGTIYPQPSLRLMPSELDALSAEILKVRPRAEAVEKTLHDSIDDARKVRDALLSMVGTAFEIRRGLTHED